MLFYLWTKAKAREREREKGRCGGTKMVKGKYLYEEEPANSVRNESGGP